ncbi:MAG: ABC transporter permease [Candidatus Delongbacteria bacterium]|nr:ABC transporter permease [Candidatus Delongbacteria bacterium]
MILDLLKIAVSSIFKNKMRSFLTMLGIIIGIMVIILMQAAIEGFRSEMQKEINKLGAASFFITKRPTMGGDHDWKKYWKRPNITFDYAEKIENSCNSVEIVIPLLRKWGQEVKFGNKKTEQNITVNGATDNWLQLSGYDIESGRYFTGTELNEGIENVIIGKSVQNKLFEFIDPIDQYVFIRGLRFKVIGVFSEKGKSFGQDQDNFVAISAHHFQRMFGKDRNVDLLVAAKDQTLLSRAVDETIVALRRMRNLRSDDENDFEITTKDEIATKMNNIIAIIYLAALSIGGMSLVVGSIGIMNIMLVSITERTKEIGLRRSVGANKNNIMVQFLIEAVILSLFGGSFGIGAGVGISKLVSTFSKISTVAPLWTIMTAFSVSVLIGLVAGIYPAMKAGKLNPIDALRQE